MIRRLHSIRAQRTAVAAVVATLAAAPAAGAAQSATVDPGWPVLAGASRLLAGPDGGVVLVGGTGGSAGDKTVVTALAADHHALWSVGAAHECGNCKALRPSGPRPDGSYAPLGDTGGGDVVEITRDGRTRTEAQGGCVGVMAADGTCVTIGPYRWQQPATITATRNGAELWRYTEPELVSLEPGTTGPGLMAVDGAGNLYLVTDRVAMALDLGTGAVRWRQTPPLTPGRLAVALDTGFLLDEYGVGLTSVGPDGRPRWRLAVPGLSGVTADTEARRVYVQSEWNIRRRAMGRLLAADLDSGAVVWARGAPADVRLVTNGRGGLLVTRTAGPRSGLLALAPADGAIRWEWPTPTAVGTAVTASDGHVYATTAGLGWQGGLVVRLTPGVRSPRPPRRTSVALRRQTDVFCPVADCGVPPQAGRVLELAFRRPTRVWWAVDQRPIRRPYLSKGNFVAPAGRSLTGVSPTGFGPGSGLAVRLTWSEGGHRVVRTLPFR